MAILNVQVDLIGQAGQVPKLIYINTNDTIAAVTHAGYLNEIVSMGSQLSPTDMALVVTYATPNSPISNFYHVVYASGNWSLVAI